MENDIPIDDKTIALVSEVRIIRGLVHDMHPINKHPFSTPGVKTDP
jgi:hypothetical protein